jgi:hypothetical protein
LDKRRNHSCTCSGVVLLALIVIGLGGLILFFGPIHAVESNAQFSQSIPTAPVLPTPTQTSVPTATPLPVLAWASHRSGQTFLTWKERDDLQGEVYHIYRSTTPITTANWNQTQPLAAIGKNSAAFYINRYNPRGTQTWQSRYVDRLVTGYGDTLAQIPQGIGLLVWTLSAQDFAGGSAGQGFYAVTVTPAGGQELFDAQYSVGPLAETVEDPLPIDISPVLPAHPDNEGHVYIQYMDLRAWNATFHAPNPTNGYFGLDPNDPNLANNLQYAYDYQVFTPTAAMCGGKIPDKLPVFLHLHGWRDNTVTAQAPYPDQYCAYGVYPNDVTNTWFFGFARDHDFRKGGAVSAGDTIVNYTEQRVLRMIYDLERMPPGPAVDPERIYVSGQSMGGSGTLALAERYPNVFAAAYASQPVTDFRTADGVDNWQADGAIKWGSPDLNLPVSNTAPGGWAGALQKYNGVGVWDWQNYQESLSPTIKAMAGRVADQMVPLGVTHGLKDAVIGWETQAQPLYQDLDDSRQSWAAEITNTAHQWAYYQGLAPALAPLGDNPYTYIPFWGLAVVKDETVPGLSRLSGDPVFPPTWILKYNQTILWSSSWYAWDGAPIDLPDVWKMSFCSVANGSTTCGSNRKQTVDITPRRLQHFAVTPGAQYDWQNQRISDGEIVDQGSVTADANGLITVPEFLVSPMGNRLILKPHQG